MCVGWSQDAWWQALWPFGAELHAHTGHLTHGPEATFGYLCICSYLRKRPTPWVHLLLWGDGCEPPSSRDGPCRLSAVYTPLSCMIIPIEDAITGNSAFPLQTNIEALRAAVLMYCFSFPFKNWNMTDMQCSGNLRWWCFSGKTHLVGWGQGLHSVPWLMKYLKGTLFEVFVLGGFLFCFVF